MRSIIPALSMSLLLLTACSSEKGSDAAPPGSTVSGSNSGFTTSSVDMDSIEIGGSDLNTVSTSVAKEVALRRAGVSDSDVQGYKVVTNMDKGYLEYHITFWVDTVEHFYILLGSDGSVISFSTVFHETGYDPSNDVVEEEEEEEPEQEFVAAMNTLTSDQVRELLAKEANISVSSMKTVVITEGMNGSIPQYTVTFSTDDANYRYTLSASTGMIFSSNKELLPEEEDGLVLNTNPSTTTPNTSTTTPSTSTTTPNTSTTTPSTSTTTPNTSTTTPEVTAPSTTPETTTPEVTVPPVENTPNLEPESTTPPIYGENVGMAG